MDAVYKEHIQNCQIGVADAANEDDFDESARRGSNMADTVMQMVQDQTTPDPIGQGINLFGPSPALSEEYCRRAQAQISRR